jgi:hypothetical protein
VHQLSAKPSGHIKIEELEEKPYSKKNSHDSDNILTQKPQNISGNFKKNNFIWRVKSSKKCFDREVSIGERES